MAVTMILISEENYLFSKMFLLFASLLLTVCAAYLVGNRCHRTCICRSKVTILFKQNRIVIIFCSKYQLAQNGEAPTSVQSSRRELI
jgi:hypothetical protein